MLNELLRKLHIQFSGLKGRKVDFVDLERDSAKQASLMALAALSVQNHKKIGLKNYSKIDLKDFLLDFRKILRNKVTT